MIKAGKAESPGTVFRYMVRFAGCTSLFHSLFLSKQGISDSFLFRNNSGGFYLNQ